MANIKKVEQGFPVSIQDEEYVRLVSQISDLWDDARDLRFYRQFYQNFNDLEIWYACVPNLNWTHFRSLSRVVDEDAG